MAMSRKHYVQLAQEIQDVRLQGWIEPEQAITALAEQIADVLQADNPAFDRDRFLKAAGVR